MNKKYKIIALTGPAGSGKDTLIYELFNDINDNKELNKLIEKDKLSARTPLKSTAKSLTAPISALSSSLTPFQELSLNNVLIYEKIPTKQIGRD
mgnify:CR=1 FL=1